MSRTDALRQQTKELIKTLTRIGFQLRLGGNHAALFRELTEIAIQLDQHLHVEEKEIYPALDHSKDALARQISRVSHRELDQLDHQMADFVRRWSSGSGVASDPATFTHEATGLVDQLRRMLGVELTNLFPTAERQP